SNYYINKFYQFKNENRIKNANYEDLEWIICEENDNGKIVNRNVYFPFQLRQEVNDILKSYTINLIKNAICINTVSAEIKVISNIIYNSNFFDKNMINEFEEYIDSLEVHSKVVAKDKAMKFISFIRSRVDDVYCDYLSTLPNDYSNKYVREVPDYTSILKFDYIVDKYIKESDDEKFYKYYPVFLWWKISSKIPLRPCEFMLLKKNSFYELSGKYYIVVRRLKPHGFVNRALKIRKTQEFRINKEIYELVQRVTNHKLHDSEFLLSKNLYANYYDKHTFNEGRIVNQPMTRGNLNKCLEDFYLDEIKAKFKLNLLNKKEAEKFQQISKKDFLSNYIVCLQLGDARHLAIINLVLQGTNSYLVREMCGHRDINSHAHYIDHAKTYITSKVLLLTELRKTELEVIAKNKQLNYIYRNRRNEKAVSYGLEKYKKVGEYYCRRYIGKDELFPFLCLTDCDECNDKVIKIQGRDLGLIENDINQNNLELERQIGILEIYIKDANIKNIIDKNKGKFFSESQQNVEEAANKLDYLIEQKANLEAEKFYNNIITD
ncbi:hypothetical protein, partial [Clostridium cibarium]